MAAKEKGPYASTDGKKDPTHVFLNECVYVRVSVSVFVCVCVYVYVYVHACMSVCMCVCLCGICGTAPMCGHPFGTQ